MQTRQKPNFSHRNFTTLSCLRSTVWNSPNEPQFINVIHYLNHGLSKRNVFYLSFFRFSYLFLYIFSWIILNFPVFYVHSIHLPLHKCLNPENFKKSSHGNIYIAKQHICYTVELHCLYENRSPDDAIVILMIPCFFLLNYICDWFDW